MSEAQEQAVQAQVQAKASRRGALWLLVPVAVGVAVGVTLALTRNDEVALSSVDEPEASRLAAVGAYDPEGDAHENSAAVGRATDGDPATYWETETYRDFRSLKSGVGLVLEAPEGATELLVRSETPGFTARIDGGAEAGGPFEALAAEQEIGDATSFDLGDAGARYVVLWITQLPEGVARINEVEAR